MLKRKQISSNTEINIVSGDVIGREIPSSKVNPRFVAIVENLICTQAFLYHLPRRHPLKHINGPHRIRTFSIIGGTEGNELVWVPFLNVVYDGGNISFSSRRQKGFKYLVYRRGTAFPNYGFKGTLSGAARLGDDSSNM